MLDESVVPSPSVLIGAYLWLTLHPPPSWRPWRSIVSTGTRTIDETEPIRVNPLKSEKGGSSMSVQLIRATTEHVPELARIMYDAFACVAHKHAYQPEVFSPEMAVGAMTSFVT